MVAGFSARQHTPGGRQPAMGASRCRNTRRPRPRIRRGSCWAPE